MFTLYVIDVYLLHHRLSIHPPIDLSINLSTHSPIITNPLSHPPNYSFFSPTTCTTIRLPNHPIIYPPNHPFIQPPTQSSTYPTIYLSFHLSTIHPHIYHPIHLPNHESIQLSPNNPPLNHPPTDTFMYHLSIFPSILTFTHHLYMHSSIHLSILLPPSHISIHIPTELSMHFQ